MTDPIQRLKDEHRIIEKVLTALTAAARREVPLEFYEQALDFIVNFADRCHHAKEEDRLFPLLERKGIPHEGGPIGVMCHEHVIGRNHVRRMKDLIAAKDGKGLREESLGYVALLKDHIYKEDNILFAMGDNVLGKTERDALATDFDEVDREMNCHARYDKLANDLLQQTGQTLT